jgi:hypothetical protein
MHLRRRLAFVVLIPLIQAAAGFQGRQPTRPPPKPEDQIINVE